MHGLMISLLVITIVAAGFATYLSWWRARGDRFGAFRRDRAVDRALSLTVLVIGVCALLLELGWIK